MWPILLKYTIVEVIFQSQSHQKKILMAGRNNKIEQHQFDLN